MGYQMQIALGIILLCVAVVLGFFSKQFIQDGLANRKTAIEHEKNLSILKPKISINLYPSHAGDLSPDNRYPLREYFFMIQNTNKASAEILNCRIKFFFPNIIFKTTSHPLIPSGEGVSISGVSIYKNVKGVIQTYEERPLDNSIVDVFSLEIESALVNGVSMNTNIALFTCSKWPKDVGFSGTFVVDQSKRPQFFKNPANIGTYSGIYNYVVDGKTYEEKITGLIEPITNQSSGLNSPPSALR